MPWTPFLRFPGASANANSAAASFSTRMQEILRIDEEKHRERRRALGMVTCGNPKEADDGKTRASRAWRAAISSNDAIPTLRSFLEQHVDQCRFSFFVIPAALREIVVSALAGILADDHICGTELEFDSVSGEVCAIGRVPAGYGKVAVIAELGRRLRVATDRVIYVGDGSANVDVMLHVNNHVGFIRSLTGAAAIRAA